MYDWIENQIEQIGEQSHVFVDEVDEETFRAMTQGRLLEIEFMLESEMIKQYLTKNQIICLRLSLDFTDANLFCKD